MTVKNLTWGQDLWHVIHTLAKCYPKQPSPQYKKIALQFVKLIAYILPCMSCRRHYMMNITKYPAKVNSGIEFFSWTVYIHNTVNRQTSNGKSKPWTPVQGYQATDGCLNSKKLKRLLSVLFLESRRGVLHPMHLQRFIDFTTLLSKSPSSTWSIPEVKQCETKKKHDIQLHKK